MAASLGPTKGKHYHHIIITTSLSPHHYHHSIITTALLPHHYHHIIITTSSSSHHYHRIIITTSLPPQHYHHIIITTALSPQHSLWGLMEALQALEGNHKSCQSACQCACVRAMEQKKPRLLGPAVFRKQNWTQEEQRANSKHTKPQLSGPACTKKSRFVHRRGKGQAHSQMSVVVCLSLNRSSAECTRITCAHEKCL